MVSYYIKFYNMLFTQKNFRDLSVLIHGIDIVYFNCCMPLYEWASVLVFFFISILIDVHTFSLVFVKP